MKFENQKYYNCEITLNDKEKYLVSANWMHNNDLDHWQGWECSAGHLRLDIDSKFDVYSGQCKNDFLGNLFTGWKVFDRPGICLQERCTGCTDDLIVAKQKITGATK